MLQVGSLMSRDTLTVPPACSVESALRLLRDRKVHHVLVTEHERLVGVLSERDLLARPELEPRKRADAEAGQAEEVRERMSASVEIVTREESVSRACRRILERRIGCLPVVRDGRVTGVLTESDLMKLYVRVCRYSGHDLPLDPPVESVMSRDVVVIAPDRSAAEAYELARAKGIRHLPVVHDGWLVGIVSDHDLLPVIGRGEGELRRVEDLATMDFMAVAPETPLSQVAENMLQNGYHALPVLVNGALRGIVTSVDVLRTLCSVDEGVLDQAWTGEEVLSESRVEE
jgi:CBS domain-containing protein